MNYCNTILIRGINRIILFMKTIKNDCLYLLHSNSKSISIENCWTLLRWRFILEAKAPNRDMERILMD